MNINIAQMTPKAPLELEEASTIYKFPSDG